MEGTDALSMETVYECVKAFCCIHTSPSQLCPLFDQRTIRERRGEKNAAILPASSRHSDLYGQSFSLSNAEWYKTNT